MFQKLLNDNNFITHQTKSSQECVIKKTIFSYSVTTILRIDNFNYWKFLKQ